MESITLHWQKCNNYLFWGSWCRLDSDLLDDPRLEISLGRNLFGFDTSIGITGVYIIWAGVGDNRTILKVGSGIIKDRLQAHLNDPKVQAYKSKGLYATWATLPLYFQLARKLGDSERGVERFLGVMLNPKLTQRLPTNVEFIWVNLPEWNEPENPFLRVRKQGSYLWPNRPPIELKS